MRLLTLRYLKLADKYQAPGVEAAVLAQLQNRPKQDMPSILALGLIYGSAETDRHALKHFDGGWKIPPDTQRVKPVFCRPCRTLTNVPPHLYLRIPREMWFRLQPYQQAMFDQDKTSESHSWCRLSALLLKVCRWSASCD